MKTKYKYFLVWLLTLAFFFSTVDFTSAWSISDLFTSSSSSWWGRPEINCAGLPGCDSWDIEKVSTSSNKAISVIGRLIGEMIKYTAVLAVVALMIAGIMYLVSGGEEERVKKAKKWIIWSLIGVLVSVSAWFIVNVINNLSIG